MSNTSRVMCGIYFGPPYKIFSHNWILSRCTADATAHLPPSLLNFRNIQFTNNESFNLTWELFLKCCNLDIEPSLIFIRTIRASCYCSVFKQKKNCLWMTCQKIFMQYIFMQYFILDSLLSCKIKGRSCRLLLDWPWTCAFFWTGRRRPEGLGSNWRRPETESVSCPNMWVAFWKSHCISKLWKPSIPHLIFIIITIPMAKK